MDGLTLALFKFLRGENFYFLIIYLYLCMNMYQLIKQTN